MTYLQFLAVFLLPPIVVLLLLGRRRLPRALGWQLLAIVVVAFIYTAPWDGGLIANRVWSYPAAQVAGPSLLRVPFEEFGFYALQTVMTGLFTALLLRRLTREG
ncbi:MAG: hypothetical protein NVSMB29_06740 [Candidatus Dormibacteria bacterium]